MTKEAPDFETILYEVPEGDINLDVRLEQEAFWLSQRKTAALFEKNTDTIGLHLRKIFK